MIVCSCNVLTETMIARFIDQAGNVRRARDVYYGMGCRQRCGLCAQTIRNIISAREQTGLSVGCHATKFGRGHAEGRA